VWCEQLFTKSIVMDPELFILDPDPTSEKFRIKIFWYGIIGPM
jgi:hypothetical protein